MFIILIRSAKTSEGIKSRLIYVFFLFLLQFTVSCKQKQAKELIRPEVAKLIKQADSLLENGWDEKSITYLNKIIPTYAPLNITEKLRYYEFNRYFYTVVMRKFDKSNQYADSALLIFKDPDIRIAYFEEYKLWIFNKGDALVALKRLQESFSYYHKGKEMIEKMHDTCSKSHFSTRLGVIRYQQMNYRDAIRYFKQAFDECQLCTTTYGSDHYFALIEPQGDLNGIGMFYELLNKPDSALIYYSKALDFINQKEKYFSDNAAGTLHSKAVVWGNMGGVYAKLDSLEKAEVLLVKSVAVNKVPGAEQRDVQTAQIKLADVYIKQGKLAEAQSLLTDVQAGLDTLPNTNYKIRWLMANCELSKKKNDIQAAFNWLKQYNQENDSMVLINQSMMSADFVREFENMDHLSSIALLKTQNKQNLTMLMFSILAFILACGISWTIYQNWQLSIKNERHLKLLNDEINQKNEKLQLTLLALQDSQQDNTRLMAMVAHDLRTPAANIQMATNYLYINSDISEKDRSFVEIIHKSAIRSLEMIDAVMHSNEKLPSIDGNIVNLDAMLIDCVELMQLRANEKKQQILLETVPLSIKGSHEKMWRVISNLISNAIKFTPRLGTIRVTLTRETDDALIRVADNGIGIPMQDQDELFNIDKVPRREGTEGESTTGLGLAIVKQIVSAYKGRIYFESYPDSGTTFFVHLPLSNPEIV